LKKGRSDKCEECNAIFKSGKAKTQHMITNHGAECPESKSLVETKIQCNQCNLQEFTMETIKEHLSVAHQIIETDNWERFVREVEFEMDVTNEVS
jgi:uncharacterized C2H2 Zn-finger protein